ncbi:MAG: energy transducer TonB [Bacteroidales bacterium]|nr:energy transducer TonB [Bacteroidales bacterium]
MEAKKSPKADLENKKFIFGEIGAVLILSLVLVAFNIRSTDKKDSGPAMNLGFTEIEEEVFNTEEDQPEPEPEPETPEPEVVTEVEVVENDAELTHELGIVDASDDANKAQEEVKIEAPQEEDLGQEEEIFVFVEQEPEYPGGTDALYKYLHDNLKYPDIARDNNISGVCYINFVVEKDGSISRAVIKRDIGGGCGAEALRVVKGMPKWKPGKQGGRAVRSEFMLPVEFILQ